MIIIGALKKIIDNVKYNGGVDRMTEKDEIKYKEKKYERRKEDEICKECRRNGYDIE